MNLWGYALREACRRPGRSLLTLAGIAAGVATVVATWVAIGAARRSCRDLFDGVSGPVALEVSAAADAAFDPAVVADLARVPGVSGVLAEIQAVASVSTLDGPVPVLVLGAEPDSADIATRFRVTAGRLPRTDEEVAVSTALAETCGLTTNGTLQLGSQAGQVGLRVVGAFRSDVDGGGVNTAVVALATA